MTPPTQRTNPLWVAVGFMLTGLGFLGLILPGLPGTVFFVLAAAAFAKGDPRWEAWLLSRPVVGQMVQDYREGKGMPLRAKWIACACIVVLNAPAVVAQLTRSVSICGSERWNDSHSRW